MNIYLKFYYLHIIIIYLICLFLFSSAILKVTSTYNLNEGSTSIQQADDAITSAFEAVLKAENVGANVTNLMTRLNEAVGDLSDAKGQLMIGSSGDITELVEHSVEIAGQVKNEAQGLQAKTLSDHDYISKIIVIESLAGVIIYLLSMIFLWGLFKNYYSQKILSLKPEVIENVNT